MDSSLIPNIELFISEIDPFSQLPKAIISEIATKIEIKYFPEGEALPISEKKEEQYLYLIRMGTVEQKKANGELRARLVEGDLFGFSIFSDSVENYKALAVENALIYQVPYKVINQLLIEHPEYASFFATRTSDRLHKATSDHSQNEQYDTTLTKAVGTIANQQLAIVNSSTSIQQTAIKMNEQKRSSVLIMDDEQVIGIATDRDMTKRVVAKGLDIQQPISMIMTPNPIMITSEKLVLNAISLMMEHNIRNLPVLEQGKPVGILSATDLVKQNSMQSIFIIDHIFEATTLERLVELSYQKQEIFKALIENGEKYHSVMKVMTLIADAFAQKLLMMAENQLGKPPCDYVWLVSGSQARYEMHPLSDQDNAIVTEREVDIMEGAYFKQLAQFVNEGLDKCGYELCSGNYMASNPKWCQPISKWKAYFDEWIKTPSPEGLLNVTVFMDHRMIYGEETIAKAFHQHFGSLVKNNKRFLSFLVANSIRMKPPLSILKNFVLIKDGQHKDQLNLKKRAISLLVDLGRIYAFASDLDKTMTTEQRFVASYKAGIINKATLADVLGAYEFVSQVRFKYQLQELKQNQPLTNHINPDDLTSLERNNLKDAFRLIGDIQDAAELRFSQQGLLV